MLQPYLYLQLTGELLCFIRLSNQSNIPTPPTSDHVVALTCCMHKLLKGAEKLSPLLLRLLRRRPRLRLRY